MRGVRVMAVLVGCALVLLWWQSRGGGASGAAVAPAAPERGDEGRALTATPAVGVAGARAEGVGAGAVGALDPVPPGAQPHWLVSTFAPRPGEDPIAYRDRVVPLVQSVVEPQRRRVVRLRAGLAVEAGLDDDQLAELDAAVAAAVADIERRVMEGLFSGELLPPNVKPSAGVAFARDVLDAVDGANRRFQGALTEAQRETLAASRFDVAEYLFFATRWEDMVGYVSEPRP
jgi:hypothetical protein